MQKVPQDNGYKAGVSLWNTWGVAIVSVAVTVFSLAAAWFSLEGRVSAVELDHQNIEDNLSEIRKDVRWMRDNWENRQ